MLPHHVLTLFVLNLDGKMYRRVSFKDIRVLSWILLFSFGHLFDVIRILFPFWLKLSIDCFFSLEFGPGKPQLSGVTVLWYLKEYRDLSGEMWKWN